MSHQDLRQKKFEKIAAHRIFSNSWGSWASPASRSVHDNPDCSGGSVGNERLTGLRNSKGVGLPYPLPRRAKIRLRAIRRFASRGRFH
jgi:hypothetical protein